MKTITAALALAAFLTATACTVEAPVPTVSSPHDGYAASAETTAATGIVEWRVVADDQVATEHLMFGVDESGAVVTQFHTSIDRTTNVATLESQFPEQGQLRASPTAVLEDTLPDTARANVLRLQHDVAPTATQRTKLGCALALAALIVATVGTDGLAFLIAEAAFAEACHDQKL